MRHPRTALVPPRPNEPNRPSQLAQLWLTLPAENRQHLLNALSRVVAVHLTRLPELREVTHD